MELGLLFRIFFRQKKLRAEWGLDLKLGFFGEFGHLERKEGKVGGRKSGSWDINEDLCWRRLVETHLGMAI